MDYHFKRCIEKKNLIKVGIVDPDNFKAVEAVDFLAKESVYPEARITGYFGNLTKNASIRFQKKYGISPQIGYVGAKTRTKINILLLN